MGWPRRIVSVVVLVLVVSLTVRTWIVQGIVLPVRVVSGSMGASLPGPHWFVACKECGFTFRCGKEYPPRDNLAVCPNCGCGTNDLSDVVPRRGHRVLIDKLSLHVRPPRRWDVIAAYLPGSGARLTVKRVVGLPGESVSIRHGDLYVNGQIVRKPAETLLSMAELVHDSAYRPRNPHRGPRRWQPRQRRSGWKEDAGCFRFAPEVSMSAQPLTINQWGKTPASVSLAFGQIQFALPHANQAKRTDVCRSFADRDAEIPLDWLVYHHVSCLPAPSLRNRETPVFDSYAYNQGLTRQLHEVGDLLLAARVKISGRGMLAVELHDGWGPFQLVWQSDDRSVRLFRDSSEVAHDEADELADGAPVDLLFSVCDHQFVFAANGKTVLAYRYAAKTVPRQPPARPLAIGAAGLTMEIARLRVWRDVYYTHPQGTSEEWSLGRKLARDEYFLLGDNSPISRDGRYGPASGIVRRRAIIGRVIPFPLGEISGPPEPMQPSASDNDSDNNIVLASFSYGFS